MPICISTGAMHEDRVQRGGHEQHAQPEQGRAESSAASGVRRLVRSGRNELVREPDEEAGPVKITGGAANRWQF